MSVDAEYLRSLWTLVPDRRSCSYGKQTAPGVFAFTSVVETFHRNLKVVEGEPSAGKYHRSTKEWYAPKSENPTLLPVVADLWVEGNETWRVLTVGEKGAQGTWELGTVKLDIPTPTRDTVTIFRPTVGSDTRTMRQTTAGTTVASGLTAAISLVDNFGGTPIAAGNYNEEWQMPGTFRVYLLGEVDAKAQDRLTDQNGNVYSVTNVVNPSSIEQLMALDCLRLS